MGEALSTVTDEDRLVEALLSLDRPVPRYTSYPPANHFEDLDPETFIRAVSRSRAGDPLALYMHLPFCRRKCAYCGCFSLVPSGRDQVNDYLDGMIEEIRLYAAMFEGKRKVAQLQWGGGTPNHLDPAGMERLMRAVVTGFGLAPGAEIGVELDPTFLTKEQVLALKDLGFNRVSLGVQDLNETVQRLIGRGQTRRKTLEAFEMCRSSGFDSIHLDLVYGLPGQTLETFSTTLQQVIELGPDRLSLFSFAYLPGLRPNQASLDADKIPGQRQKAELYARAVATLEREGYVRIGMDHFSRPHDELATAYKDGRLHRNFQGYTAMPAPDLLGLGVSAISDFQGVYTQNTKDLGEYEAMVSNGSAATKRGFSCSREDLLRKAVIESIMCNGAIDFGRIEKEHMEPGESFTEHFEEELRELAGPDFGGVVDLKDDGLELSADAWPLSRLVASVFDQYLKRGGTYSRMI